jgi:hypothetical protein
MIERLDLPGFNAGILDSNSHFSDTPKRRAIRSASSSSRKLLSHHTTTLAVRTNALWKGGHDPNPTDLTEGVEL